MIPNWYVVTGGPSTGKTTLLYRLSLRGYKTVPEAARAVIDEAIEKGMTVEELRSNERHFQELVLDRKVQVESELDPQQLTFFDRGMHDTTAYISYYGDELTDKEKKTISQSKYKAVFLLDTLDEYKEDYARVEDETFRVKIQELLEKAYTDDGITVVRVPDIGLNDRVEFILDYVRREAK
jgi:predicted ATPase